MGDIKLSVPDGLEEKFRNKVFEKYGYKKGNLSKAGKEALKDWIEKND